MSFGRGFKIHVFGTGGIGNPKRHSFRPFFCGFLCVYEFVAMSAVEFVSFAHVMNLSINLVTSSRDASSYIGEF